MVEKLPGSGISLSELKPLFREINTALIPEKIKRIRDLGPKAVTLVLSGGGALSPTHIGAVGTLLEAGIPLNLVVGTSAGAIGGVVAAFVGSKEDYLYTKRMGETVQWNLLAEKTESGFLPFYRFDHLANYINQNIAALKNRHRDTELVIVAMDISNLRIIQTHLFWGSYDVGKAVQASCCVPLVVQPLKIGRQTFTDGGANHLHVLPLGIADILTPAALKIAVSLVKSIPNINDKNTILIQPAIDDHNSLGTMLSFDSRNVLSGYLSAQTELPKILAEMEKRAIESVFRPGFKNIRLENYFGDRFI